MTTNAIQEAAVKIAGILNNNEANKNKPKDKHNHDNIQMKPDINMQKNKIARWKRTTRKMDEADKVTNVVYPTQEGGMGATRSRNMKDEEDTQLQLFSKIHYNLVPSLEECLGADNLCKIREGEDQHLKNQMQDHTRVEEEVVESYVQI
jgi:hypothetical protein